MIASPAKRRKVDRNPGPDASHQSHRDGDSKGQRLGGERSFGLRDRKALRPSLPSSGSPTKEPRLPGSSSLASPSRGSSAMQAFSAPPRRSPRKTSPSKLKFERQREEHTDLGDNKLSEFDSTPSATTAAAAEAEGGDADNTGEDGEDLIPSSSRIGFEEPDLPPTPTQLGLERPLERPQLLSSSPSMRQEKRARRRTTDVFQSSSLVFDNTAQIIGEAEDQSGGEVKGKVARPEKELLPESILRKRRLRDQLSARERQTRDSIAELEEWMKISDHEDHNGGVVDMEKFKSMMYVALLFIHLLFFPSVLTSLSWQIIVRKRIVQNVYHSL